MWSGVWIALSCGEPFEKGFDLDIQRVSKSAIEKHLTK